MHKLSTHEIGYSFWRPAKDTREQNLFGWKLIYQIKNPVLHKDMISENMLEQMRF